MSTAIGLAWALAACGSDPIVELDIPVPPGTESIVIVERNAVATTRAYAYDWPPDEMSRLPHVEGVDDSDNLEWIVLSYGQPLAEISDGLKPGQKNLSPEGGPVPPDYFAQLRVGFKNGQAIEAEPLDQPPSYVGEVRASDFRDAFACVDFEATGRPWELDDESEATAAIGLDGETAWAAFGPRLFEITLQDGPTQILEDTVVGTITSLARGDDGTIYVATSTDGSAVIWSGQRGGTFERLPDRMVDSGRYVIDHMAIGTQGELYTLDRGERLHRYTERDGWFQFVLDPVPLNPSSPKALLALSDGRVLLHNPTPANRERLFLANGDTAQVEPLPPPTTGFELQALTESKLGVIAMWSEPGAGGAAFRRRVETDNGVSWEIMEFEGAPQTPYSIAPYKRGFVFSGRFGYIWQNTGRGFCPRAEEGVAASLITNHLVPMGPNRFLMVGDFYNTRDQYDGIPPIVIAEGSSF